MAKQQSFVQLLIGTINGMLEDDENTSEWVQSKITKAVDYLDKNVIILNQMIKKFHSKKSI